MTKTIQPVTRPPIIVELVIWAGCIVFLYLACVVGFSL